MRTVLAFGTFDGLHPGHDFFLSAAAGLGDRLVASVARDAHVRELKRKSPMRDEQERLRAVRAREDVDEADLSDETLGSFEVISRVRPDVIAIGHDQDALAGALTDWMQARGLSIPIRRIARTDRDPHAQPPNLDRD